MRMHMDDFSSPAGTKISPTLVINCLQGFSPGSYTSYFRDSFERLRMYEDRLP